MPAFARAALLLALVVLAGACASGRQGPAPPPEARTTVQVRNQSWLTINVYVTTGAQRVRLGTVNGNAEAILEIPRHVVGLGREVSFLADPIGSANVAQSYEMFVRPGDEVSITIPSQVR